MLVTFGVTGVLAETANLFRSNAGDRAPALCASARGRGLPDQAYTRVLLAMLLLLSAAFPGLLFRELYARRNVFLEPQPGAVLSLAEYTPSGILFTSVSPT